MYLIPIHQVPCPAYDHIPSAEIYSVVHTNKVIGPDNIPTIILKNYALELASIHTELFNLSLFSGMCPKNVEIRLGVSHSKER